MMQTFSNLSSCNIFVRHSTADGSGQCAQLSEFPLSSMSSSPLSSSSPSPSPIILESSSSSSSRPSIIQFRSSSGTTHWSLHFCVDDTEALWVGTDEAGTATSLGKFHSVRPCWHCGPDVSVCKDGRGLEGVWGINKDGYKSCVS